MRVAVYHNLPSGGGKRALFHFTQGLATRHTVDVYSLTSAEHVFCDLRPFARRHVTSPFVPAPALRRPFGRLNPAVRWIDLLRLDALHRRIAARIDAEGYDVVFVHHCRYGQSPSLLRHLRTPSVYYCAEPPRWLHDVAPPRPYAVGMRERADAYDPLLRLHRRWCLAVDTRNTRAATLLLANSEFSRRRLEAIYGVPARLGRLGVDTNVFRPLPEPEGPHVLSVGALGAMKGFDFVIHGLAAIAPAGRPALTIVCNAADPREEAYLVRLAAERGVRLTLRPAIDDAELVRAYNRARLTLYAPILEPLGLVALESMACGTPVVGVGEAGVRETVMHERTGVLVDRDPLRFAAAVDALLHDDARRTAYGRRGPEYVATDWSWDAALIGLEAQLMDAAARRPGRGG